ncbi:MAG: WD40/YVTN/BNR-like repeat-containing protein [Bryobacteraceae bacterium]
MTRLAGIAGLLFWMASCARGQVWRVQFSPKGGEAVAFSDLKFASADRGIAVGRAGRGQGAKPLALLTADGGRRWSRVSLQEEGQSLFFLNEVNGWMVTGGGLWKTSDFGATWSKLPEASTPEVTRVHFLDERRGWAVGPLKGFYQTGDGGASWSRVAAGQEAAGTPEYTSYDCLTFVGGRFGMAAGASIPPQPGGAPGRRELPHLTIFLDTRDAGATWSASTASMFGRVTKVVFAPDGRGLGLIQFQSGFEFPSEVFQIEWKTGKSWRAFRRADCAVTDIDLGASGQAWLAAIERTGHSRRGRLRIFESRDLVEWTEMSIEGRPKAARAVLAAAEGGPAWVATDEGTILRLVTK